MKLLLLLISICSLLLANIGEVTALQGSADLLRQTKTIKIAKGLQIQEGDTVDTKNNSKVQIILNDDTVVTIGPHSHYQFDTFKEGATPEVNMQISRGFFKTVTGKIGKIAPERFKIKTKAATIGIRGTQFMAYIGDKDEKIGCIKGKISISTSTGTFEVIAGQMIIYHNKKWEIMPIQMDAFSPVMVGMKFIHQKQKLSEFHLPKLQDSYILQEQIIENRGQPFSFDLGVDSNTQPPAFNP